ncbi:SDR family oxidoreductase [Actinopolymorpha cephalotaxi]|uniref:SDR family oxidoreductase n=1 Tax=Actinopolymorpha cephalotaxi TaxID=504797 RepID=UPI000B817921
MPLLTSRTTRPGGVAAVAESGGTATAIPADLSDLASTTAAVERVSSEIGAPRVLVNAAATDAPGPAEDLAVEDWERVVRVNLTAPFLLAKLAFPYMRQAGGGTIVNVASVAGRRGWPNATAYCATKFGLTGLTQALAAEGAPHGIRVMSMYPGSMATHWGSFEPSDRMRREPRPAEESLPAREVADYIAWLVTAPDHLVVTEAVVAPIRERGWP